MANVVREDIVQISFDVLDNPFQEIAHEINEMKNSITGSVNSGENSVKDLAEEAQATGDALSEAFDTSGVKNMTAEISEATYSAAQLSGTLTTLSPESFVSITGAAAELNQDLQETSKAAQAVKAGIAQFDSAFDSAKTKASEFVSKLKEIASVGLDKISHPIQTIKTALGNAKEAASGFVTKLKDIGKQKITSLTSNMKQIKSALTEGKSGASGFVTALKNIGKVSVSGVVSGLKNIGSLAITGASGLGKLAQTKLSNLKTALADIPTKLKEIASAAKSAAANIAKITLKGLGVAAGAGAAALSAAVTGAVTSYADYEQLVGGVETLFKDSAGTVQQYAAEAYKTAGLSANDYMETVTGFSASLLQSVGNDTVKAADLANQALIDMSDNANKMGTDMESIQNAYQGFAKQNYTMLDNLKLGYGGTQDEMQRLLTDAQKLTGQKYNISSFADITEAIHAIQTEMDITGTTAKEAESTISGSLGMLKSSWSNLLTGLVRGGDNLDVCINNLVSSAKAFAGNIMPAIQSALSGVGQLIEGLAPMIGEVLPTLVSDLLPTLTSSVVQLLESLMTAAIDNASIVGEGLAEALKYAVSGITTIVPELWSAVFSIAESLAASLSEALPDIIDNILNGFLTMITNAPAMLQSGINIIISLINGIMDAVPTIVSYAPEIIAALVVGIIGAIPQLLSAAGQIISAVWDGITSVNWLDLGAQIIKGIWDGIKSLAGSIWDGIKSIFSGGSGSAELDSIGENTGASYAQSLSSGLKTSTPDTSALTSGLDIDLSAQGLASATSWSNSFSASMTTEGAGLTSATEGLSTGLNIDLTEQGTASATSWSNSFGAGLSSGGTDLTATVESIKTTMSMDLTVEGTQSASSWGNGFTSGITETATTVSGTMESLKSSLTLDLSAQSSAASSTVTNSCTACVNAVNAAVTQITAKVKTGCATANTTVKSGTNTIKNTITSGMNQIVSQTRSGMNSFNAALRSGMNTAISTVRSGISKLKSLFNFSWELPKIKLPHFSISGSFSLDPPSMPEIGVEWYKNGGIMTNPTMFGVNGNNAMIGGESGAEAILPLDKFWNSLKKFTDESHLKYSPEHDAAVYNNSSSSSEQVNNFNPVFNLTISGSKSDRETERKVKRWVQESLQEMLESMERRNPQTQLI